MEDVLCYWKQLLSEYASLTKWTVERDPGLRLVAS